jgi:hypothetical protein
MSVSSRPVDIAYLTVARTAFMFGAHPSGVLFLLYIEGEVASAFVLDVHPTSYIERGSA